MPRKNRSAPAAEQADPVAAHELAALFGDFSNFKRVIVAVSGGPDSVAMLVLAQRWRRQRGSGPKLFAATVDHGLRKEAAHEARAVAALCRKLKIEHRTLRWRGQKPATAIQKTARDARYRLLLDLAQEIRANAIATAHTQDDQAETVLQRLVSGSGITGLAAIRKQTSRGTIAVLRPLLDVAKARLVATLAAEKIPFAIDPSNDDPRFTRVRLRLLLAALEGEGLNAARLAVLAKRLDRADAALEALADDAQRVVSPRAWKPGLPIVFDAQPLFGLPNEIALRLLRRAVDHAGIEGPSELAKLEELYLALVTADRARRGLKRTLAGALVTLSGSSLGVTAAPPRKSSISKRLRVIQPA